MRARISGGFFFIVLFFGLPACTHAATIWRSAPTHPDEVLIFTQGVNLWYNGTATTSLAGLGVWNRPAFVTDASTTAHMWIQRNGPSSLPLPIVEYFLQVTPAPNGIYENNIAHNIIFVNATSSLQEYVFPTWQGITISPGDKMSARVFTMIPTPGIDYWMGSNGVTPYFEICEGLCGTNDAPPTITLLGAATTTVEFGSTFTDPGATAQDDIDGNITSAIHVAGSVDTGVTGTTTLAYSVTNSRGLSATTTRAIIVACTHSCYSNVLFLPGTEASRLYYRGMFNIEQQVWEPDFYTDIPYLAMNTDGTSKYSLYTKDIIDSNYGNNPVEYAAIEKVLGADGLMVYGDFEKFMDTLVANSTIKEWRAYPYDWRYDVRDIVTNGTPTKMSDGSVKQVYLKNVLENMASSSPTKKVTIVAHSNGGLLAKALAVALGADASKYIDRIVMVGTPQWGTPAAIGALLHADNFSDTPNLIVNSVDVRAAMSGMGNPYDLLPSHEYFAHISDPVATFDAGGLLSGKYATNFGAGLTSFPMLRDFLTNIAGLDSLMGNVNDLRAPLALSSLLVEKAVATHVALDSWVPPSGISVTAIAGWGQDTVKTLAYTTTSKVVCTNLVFTSFNACADTPSLKHVPVTTQDGDDTVVSPSAVGNTSNSLYFNALDFVHNEKKNVGHQNLTSAQPIENIIVDLLQNKSTSNEQYVSAIKPQNGANPIILRMSTHSPVNLIVTDAIGNQSGVLPLPGTDFSGVRRGIPGGSVQVFDDEEYVSVPQSGTYRVVASGYATGSATLDVETLGSDGAVTTTTTFANIPTTASSTAIFSVVSGMPTSPVVDITGDGKNVFTVASATPGSSPLAYVRSMRAAVKALTLSRSVKHNLDEKLGEIEHRLSIAGKDKDGNKKGDKEKEKKDKEKEDGEKDKNEKVLHQLVELSRYIGLEVKLGAQKGIAAPAAEIILGMINQLKTLL